MVMPSAHLDRRPPHHAALPAWYRSLLDEHEASGLSLAEFAEVAGVSTTSLVRWRRRLERTGGPAARPHRLVEVHVADPGPPPAVPTSGQLDRPFTVHLAGERRIDVGAGFDAEELRRLVEALEAC